MYHSVVDVPIFKYKGNVIKDKTLNFSKGIYHYLKGNCKMQHNNYQQYIVGFIWNIHSIMD